MAVAFSLRFVEWRRDLTGASGEGEREPSGDREKSDFRC
jgi:hypothetical protein